jgi:hypothetical protein
VEAASDLAWRGRTATEEAAVEEAVPDGEDLVEEATPDEEEVVEEAAPEGEEVVEEAAPDGEGGGGAGRGGA